MGKLTIDAFMTRNPTTTEATRDLTQALELMRSQHIRHLPVLVDGKLAGILSERDAEVALASGGSQLKVGSVMVTDPFTIAPHSSLEWVAMIMAERKCGSVLVVEEGEVVGVFTTTDALHALEQLLARSRRRRTPAAERRH